MDEGVSRILEELAHFGTWEWAIGDAEVKWSPELYRIFGVTPEQFSPTLEGSLQRVHPADRSRVREELNRVFTKPSVFSHDQRILRPDGSLRYLHTWWHPVLDAKGKPVRLIGICQDITDRKLADEEREGYLSILAATIESTADGILVIDQNERITWFNQTFLGLWRISRSEIEGRGSRWALESALDQLKCPQRSFERLQDIYAHPERESCDILEFKDGRIIERYSRPQWIDSRVVGRVFSYRDISEEVRRKQQIESYISLLQATLESTADGILVVDAGGGIVTYNQTFLTLWGMPKELIETRDGPRAMAWARDQLKAPDVFAKRTAELYANPNMEGYDRLELRSGKILERYSRPQRIGANVVGRVWSFRDVTERERVVKEMNARRELLEAVLGNSPLCIALYRGEDPVVELMNPTAKREAPFRLIERKPPYEKVSSDVADMLLAEYRKVLHTGETVHFENRPLLGRYFTYSRMRVRLPDGDYGVLFLGNDTADQVFLRRKVELARDRAEYLAEAGRVLVGSLDYETTLANVMQQIVPRLADWCLLSLFEDGSVRSLAAAGDPGKAAFARELERLQPTDKIAEWMSKAIHANYSQLYSESIDEQVVAANEPKAFEIIKALGLQSCMAIPMFIRSSPLGAILIAYNQPKRRYGLEDLALAEEVVGRCVTAIDNARLYKEAKRSIQVRDDFIAIASHELRTPLTPIKMQVQIIRRNLQEGSNDLSKLGNLLKIVKGTEQQVDRLSKLVEDLLDVSRISAGALELNSAVCDLAEIVRRATAGYSEEFKSYRCPLNLHAETAVWGRWDQQRLEQVIVNLLTNAMKYGRGMPIDITVTSTSGKAVLRVTDHGIGIAREEQARLFERFERLAPIKHYGGLGLGLYISRQIVRAHGGTIKVQSELGKGATFIVMLPLEPALAQSA